MADKDYYPADQHPRVPRRIAPPFHPPVWEGQGMAGVTFWMRHPDQGTYGSAWEALSDFLSDEEAVGDYLKSLLPGVACLLTDHIWMRNDASAHRFECSRCQATDDDVRMKRR